MATICDVCSAKAVERVIIDSTDERFDLCAKHADQFLKMMTTPIQPWPIMDALPEPGNGRTKALKKDGTPKKKPGRRPKSKADVISDDAVGL